MTAPTDLLFAHRLADIADAITRPHAGRAVEAVRKADGSPLTPVDEAVERALLAEVTAQRPDDGFLGEEVGDARQGRRRWIVDGIDGTSSFSLGRPEWATLIALDSDGELLLGIASAPAIGRRWWAGRGLGAWVGDLPHSDRPATRLGVSNSAADRPRVEAWASPWSARSEDRGLFDRLASEFRIGGDLPWSTPRPPGQRASWGSRHPGGTLLVAAGLLDGYILAGGGPWDYAAPALILEEAGGRYSDLRGGHTIDDRGGVFSNGQIHDAILAALAGRPPAR